MQVYGRKLTAMILGPNPLPHKEEWEEEVDDGSIDEWDNHSLKSSDEVSGNDHNKGVITKGSHSPKHARTVKFGEHGTAKLVHVSCS